MPKPQDIRFAKLVIFLNALVPGIVLLWDATHGNAGANPVNYAILTTGLLTLIFLCLTLLVTPLRKITGFNWLFHFRRMLGLYAFFYALSHFSIFFLFDRAASVPGTLYEIFQRPYLVIGSAAILCMVPLAATSFNSMIKRLGAKRWQALHRLVYVTAILGVIHFYLQGKSDKRLAIVYAVIIGLLLAYRVVAFLLSRKKKSAQADAAAPASTRWSGNLIIKEIIEETPDVRTFRLAPANGSPFPFTYLPGQYLTLTLSINGKKTYRNYTIASSPSRPGTCELTIKRDPNGLASRHLHDTLKPGDILALTAPAGRFTFTGKEAQAVAMLAAGVGITPLMSILRYLADSRWPGHIYLLYANKTESDIIFRRELDALKQQHPALHITLTLTRAGDTPWTGAHGRIDAKLLAATIPDLKTTPFYLCGPTEMLTATRQTLQQLGVPENHIHTESFGTKPSTADFLQGNPTATFTITFARSSKTTTTAPNSPTRPLLEVAEDLHIPADFECRSGICGTCKCKLLSGSVYMPTTDALTPEDRAANIILLCQARPREDVTLDA